MDKAERFVIRLTPGGRSAIAVLLLTGEQVAKRIDSQFQAANGKPVSRQAMNQVVFGHWGGEELVVCRTTDQEIEVHCHGGEFAWRAIVDSLLPLGFQELDWESYLARKDSLIKAEATIALGQARSKRATAHILAQKNGALEQEIHRLLQLHEKTRTSTTNATDSELTSSLDSLLSLVDFGIRLTKSWTVVLVGPPNVGKSSLINRIAGFERSIVFDQPGTTRDVVRSEIAIDGFPVTLSDTAGLRRTESQIESQGIEHAYEEIGQADLVIFVTEPTSENTSTSELFPEIRERFPEVPCLSVTNKSDLDTSDLDTSAKETCSLKTSALKGQGIEQLIGAIELQLWPDPPQPGTAIPFTERQKQLLIRAREHLQSQQPDLFEQCLRELVTKDAGP